jgi:hypothetical protein
MSSQSNAPCLYCLNNITWYSFRFLLHLKLASYPQFHYEPISHVANTKILQLLSFLSVYSQAAQANAGFLQRKLSTLIISPFKRVNKSSVSAEQAQTPTKLSFFLSPTSFYLTSLGVDGYFFMWSHTDTQPQSVGLLWTRDRPSQPHNTQHSQQTNIHAPGGVRTRDPSRRSAADPRHIHNTSY